MHRDERMRQHLVQHHATPDLARRRDRGWRDLGGPGPGARRIQGHGAGVQSAPPAYADRASRSRNEGTGRWSVGRLVCREGGCPMAVAVRLGSDRAARQQTFETGGSPMSSGRLMPVRDGFPPAWCGAQSLARRSSHESNGLGTSHMTASGGRVTSAEASCPCHGIGSASMALGVPRLEPP